MYKNGFTPGRGCNDQIFSLRQIVDKHLMVNKKVFCAFVDLEKAYDSVVRSKLWDVLKDYGVDGSLLRTMQAMYENNQACVLVDGKMSEWFRIDKGLKQGDVMSPWTFNIYMDSVMRDAHNPNAGVKIGGENVSVLLYADDVVFISDTAKGLQDIVDQFDAACEPKSLRINAWENQSSGV